MTNGHLLWQWQSLISALFSSTTFILFTFYLFLFPSLTAVSHKPSAVTKGRDSICDDDDDDDDDEEDGETMHWSCRWLFIIE